MIANGGTGWHLESVAVHNCRTHDTTTFQVDRWLDKKEVRHCLSLPVHRISPPFTVVLLQGDGKLETVCPDEGAPAPPTRFPVDLAGAPVRRPAPAVLDFAPTAPLLPVRSVLLCPVLPYPPRSCDHTTCSPDQGPFSPSTPVVRIEPTLGRDPHRRRRTSLFCRTLARCVLVRQNLINAAPARACLSALSAAKHTLPAVLNPRPPAPRWVCLEF